MSAARVDRPLAHGLLGAHVLRRAEAEARLRHALRRRRCCTASAMPKSATSARWPSLQQDVLGLDVAMDHARRARTRARSATSRAMRTASAIGSCFSRSRRLRSVSPSTTASHRTAVRRHRRCRTAAGCADAAGWPSARSRFRNRSAPMTAPSSGWSTLMATSRSCLRSCGEVDGGHAAGAEFALDAVAVGNRREETGVHQREGARAAASSRVMTCRTQLRMITMSVRSACWSRLSMRKRPSGATSYMVRNWLPT